MKKPINSESTTSSDCPAATCSACCERFAKEAGSLQAPVGGGLYPYEMRPGSQFERDKDGTWNINGCCGGGCYVVTEMKFCPFCGADLLKQNATAHAPTPETPSDNE